METDGKGSWDFDMTTLKLIYFISDFDCNANWTEWSHRAWVVELEEEAEVGREQCDLLVDVDEAAAVHDAEAGEDEHRHQHEHDQDEGAEAQQSLERRTDKSISSSMI